MAPRRFSSKRRDGATALYLRRVRTIPTSRVPPYERHIGPTRVLRRGQTVFDSIDDWLIIAVVAGILFYGSSKIPQLAHSLGRSMGEF
ncbi:MAG TPA: twin-arginine translocase TatA/TatE family subunit, partial [Thermoplasmata archaeon]|nr:twin-arginine translocase TatA/TatE family subunit [Thermoplasmata archaeon]